MALTNYKTVFRVEYKPTLDFYDKMFSIASAQMAGSHFQMRLVGPDGLQLIIQASVNLYDWIPLQTATLTGGMFTFVDPDAPSYNQRFYRAVFPQ